MSTLTLLDVGHGNCAVVQDSDATAVIDAPVGSLLLDTLADMGVQTVSVAIISHADRDHMSGILSLLTDKHIRVDQIYVNPDAQKKSRAWADFRVAVAVAELKGDCEVLTSITTTAPGSIQLGITKLNIVGPSAALALTGAGGKTPDGRAVTTNSLSAVVKVATGNNGGVLLAGDMDGVGLDDALAMGADLRARFLVFPHHGGSPGGNAAVFASKLIDAVQPSSVVFSNGRNRHDNPRLEIVQVARSSGCTVACTQLSARCGPSPVDAGPYLEERRSQGKSAHAACAGSITLMLAGGATRIPGAEGRHQTFIDLEVPTPMCRDGNASPSP